MYILQQILKELSEVETALIARGAPSSSIAAPRAYTSALALYTVGALRRYHSCLLRKCIPTIIRLSAGFGVGEDFVMWLDFGQHLRDSPYYNPITSASTSSECRLVV